MDSYRQDNPFASFLISSKFSLTYSHETPKIVSVFLKKLFSLICSNGRFRFKNLVVSFFFQISNRKVDFARLEVSDSGKWNSTTEFAQSSSHPYPEVTTLHLPLSRA